ncbi:MAG: helix-turn-helix transcriptional regulator [Haloquadratum sp.]
MTDRGARLACVVFVVVATCGGVGATAPGASAQPTETIADTQIDPDTVSLRIALGPNGSAAWTVEYRVRLDDENTTDAFLSLREDIRANESRYASEFRQRMASTAATAENATGRQMAIRNVSVTATRQRIPQDYGVVTYTFVWTNFAVVEDGTIRAGDAIAGLFLDSETSLQFTWPANYSLQTVQPDPTDERPESQIVVWYGPLDFGPNEPTLVVAESVGGGDTTTRAGGGNGATGGATDGSGDGSGGLSPVVFGTGVLVVLVAAAGGWFVYRRKEFPGGGDTPGGTDVGTGGTGPGSTAAEGSEAAAETGGVAAAESSAAAETEGSETADGESEAAETVEEELPWEDELLSNEERVLALVEHEGGRMKQQEVAQTLDWTDAKTSQVVRKMRDAGDLEAFRLGRENVLVLPDEDVGPDELG